MVIDLGAGDGRWAYEFARKDPASVYIAIDPAADSLSQYAYRASRKPSRGGADNVLFVVASLQQLPAELTGLAQLIRVNFPWGGLLRGLLKPESEALAAMASLARPGASFEILLCYDPVHDSAALEGATLPGLNEAYIDSVLAPAYANAGLLIKTRVRLAREEALAIPSTWGRRLLHGRPRQVFLLHAETRIG